jgi:ABC-type nitrate/sulfonate/bicarbonate transport system substrate-binding protein
MQLKVVLIQQVLRSKFPLHSWVRGRHNLFSPSLPIDGEIRISPLWKRGTGGDLRRQPRLHVLEKSPLIPLWQRGELFIPISTCRITAPSLNEEDCGDRPVDKRYADEPFWFTAGVGLALALCFIFGTSRPLGAQSLKKVRIASKSAGESVVPYLIPQRLGFYRDEGLDVDVIVTRGTVTTQVVVSGAVDYGNGGSIPAILGGARLKILQVSTDKPSQYLVVSPKITNVKQLSGKTVAISDASGNSTLLFRELLSKNGVPVDTVQMRALGEPSVRLGALLSGTVDATMITIGNARQAQAKGFRILLYSGDYVSALSANLETSDDKIQSSPDEVYKIVKATLKGQIFYHRNPNESARFIAEALRITDFNEAKEIWRERDKQASDIAKIGRATEEVMMTNIERVREQMRSVGATSRIKGPIPLDQVYDFTFVKKAYEEIRASKWDPMRYEYAKK